MTLSVSFPGDLRATASLPLFEQAATQTEPTVSWSPTPDLKTLFVWDLDAPNPSWLHWLVVNCDGADPSSGTEIMPWTPPTPPSGTHRYMVGIYSQTAPIRPPKPSQRGGFDPDTFVRRYSLRQLDRVGFKVSAAPNQSGGDIPPLSYTHPGANITVFTNANNPKPTLVELLKSLKRNGYSYEVIGFGEEWKGFKSKIQNYDKAIQAFRKKKGDTALAIFLDAYDCLSVVPEKTVYKQYMEKRRPMPTVIGAERGCYANNNSQVLDWYGFHFGPEYLATLKNKIKTPYENKKFMTSSEPAFLNSGFIFGPAKQLHEIFRHMNTCGIDDDQLALCDYVIKNFQKVDLDFEEKFVRNKVSDDCAKLSDEGSPEGPAFLHFPDHRTDERQEKLFGHFLAYI